MTATDHHDLPSMAPPKPAPSGIVSLIMGIAGFVVLPVVGHILAVVFGYQSRNEAAARPDLYSDDLGRVGRILGWVGLVLAGLFVLLVGLAVFVLMPV